MKTGSEILWTRFQDALFLDKPTSLWKTLAPEKRLWGGCSHGQGHTGGGPTGSKGAHLVGVADIVGSWWFFPRASEQRVLLIRGVCQTFSHLHITSWNLHTFSSSHPHIFTSSYLHIFSPAHPHIFTSSHLHILTSSSSHLLIFTSSHLHVFSSSHLLIFTSVEVRSPKTKVKLWFHASGRNPFARNEVRSPKTEVKLWFWFALVRAQPFRTKRGSIANWGKIAISQVRSQPAVFTEWGSIAKNWSKIAILKPPAQV